MFINHSEITNHDNNDTEQIKLYINIEPGSKITLKKQPESKKTSDQIFL